MKNTLLTTVSILSAALLAGCGGGGGDDAAGGGSSGGGSPEGVYGGTYDKPGSTAFRMVILDGNQFLMVYGNDGVSGFIAEGLVQGAGTTSSFANVRTFSSSARDFSNSVFTNAALSSSYIVGASSKTIDGTVTLTGNPTAINFDGGAIPGSAFNYNTAASLATVQGSWGVTGLQNDDYDLVVAGNGSFTATPTDGNPLTTPDAGCNFTGNFTPRASGKNVFDVAVTTGAGCALVGEALSGIAMAYPLNAGGTQLVLGVSNTNLAAVVTGKK